MDQNQGVRPKSLEIEEKLGLLEGMANQYCYLGAVGEERGDLVEARKLWGKARDLSQRIGMPLEVAQTQANLDGLPPGDPH